MVILFNPILDCNLRCEYCYAWRHFKGQRRYDLERMFESLEELVKKRGRTTVSLHGGEPTLMSLEDMEIVFKKIVELGARPSIQTNGTLITDKHIELFKKYNVSVGISIDGFPEENKLRTIPQVTRRIIRNIVKLRKAGINVSTISVVHIQNVGDNQKLKNFKRFLLWLKAWGIKWGRLLPVTYPGSEYGLDEKRSKEVWKDLTYFLIENELYFSPVYDIINSLLGRQNVVCVFKPCYPYNTVAADEILPDGTVTSCMRHEIHQKDDDVINIREWILYHTPQEYGGCKGCKWFPYCYGGCSANGINGDWRNRDSNCIVYKTIFETVEKILRYMGIQPVKKNWLDELRLPPYFKQIAKQYQTSHSDGIEHLDGNIRHLDSNVNLRLHSDGIEHLDGDYRHLDSDSSSRRDHSDGIEHLDGNIRHLDG